MITEYAHPLDDLVSALDKIAGNGGVELHYNPHALDHSQRWTVIVRGSWLGRAETFRDALRAAFDTALKQRLVEVEAGFDQP